ncbi:MAG TPA: glycosyltransferase family 4 protein [Candidatus Binataceae bacterium]|nr:glycosyltransferase family 4 protein [Candidatus Binataceae bacterium]
MRIAILSRRFDAHGGGTERDLIVTAQCLREAGHEIVIYADVIRSPAAEWDVRRVPGPRLGRTMGLLRFAQGAAPAARRDGAEIVLSFARAIGADIMRSGGGAHVSYVRAARQWRGAAAAAAMRFSAYHRAQMLVEWRAFQWPGLKRVIAVSELVRKDLIRQFGLAPEKTATIYNGVDLERFRPTADRTGRDSIRAQFSLPGTARVVAFVGNGFARKGLRFLIEAWRVIPGSPFLLVVGTDRAAEVYKRQAQAMGIGERVIFAGSQPDVAAIFQAVDALALPSFFEPFGNVVMEAMASGLPVLTSVHCGAAELLPPAMRAYCVRNPADTGEVAIRMTALLDAPAALRNEARAAAAKFTWKRYARELTALIDSLRA